ncbi:MAG: ABC transporter substrate-binding protein [Deltaproteobacteria bacterium]|nr:ABC transporter substrate-binding protein [Deltaproteobacteria bacterium]
MKKGTRNSLGFLVLTATLVLSMVLLPVWGTALAAKKVKIGILGPLQQRPGKALKQGAILAADEINAQGGILGKEIELAFADEEFTPEKGITALKKLALKDRVQVLAGGFTSGVTLAQMPFFSRYNLIYLGVGSASSTLTEMVKKDYEKYKYYFRVGILKDQLLAFDMGNFMVNFFGKKHGVTKVAILAEKAKWTEGLGGFLTMFFKKNGMEVVMAEFFEMKTTDFSPIFSKVKKSGAELVVEMHSHVSEIFIKQYYDQRVPLPIGGIALASQSSDFWERSGGKCVGEITSNFIYRIPISPKTIPFWDAYVKRWGEDPLVTATGAYDALYVYKDAVERAGTFETQEVIPALEKTNMVAALGRIAFEEGHELKYGPDYVAINWAQWQEGGKIVILYPESRATGKEVFPEWVKLPR